MASDPALTRVIDFYNICHETWTLIEQEKMLMHCDNAIFVYHNDFNKYMKVEGAISENVFDYLFDLRAEKFLLEKEKKYLHELFERWDPDNLQLGENFDDYSDNDGLKKIIRDKGMQNLNTLVLSALSAL